MPGRSACSIRFKNFFLLLIISVGAISSVAQATEVVLAGAAYSGTAASVGSRFPLSKKFESSLGPTGLNSLLNKVAPAIQPATYSLISRHDELLGKDQAISVAMVVTNETVSVEQIGQIYKMFVQVRGQALFFDFKSQTILRAYPFSFAYLDALPDMPTEAQKIAAIGYIYQGKNGKPGIIDRFAATLNQATLPSTVSRFVQVTNVIIGDEAKNEFPPEFANGAGESWIADTFSEALSARLGIPILPYAKGYAIDKVMSMTVADGSVYTLKLPKPDYEFTLNLGKLRKILFEEKAAGKSLIYGAYMAIKLEEPLSGHAYLESQFKNGEVKVVPASQINTEDFPAYQDSVRGLLGKLTAAVGGDGTPWLKSAASATDIDKQINATRDLLQSCK